MPALRELQRSVRAALVSDTAGAAHLVRADWLAPERRLQVYRNNFFVNFTDALEAVYPVVLRLVGEEFFGQAATRYIREHPSRSGNLHDFGRDFPRYLGRLAGTAELPWLADVARLEWAWHECFHAADGAPLNPAQLAAVAPADQPALRLRLHPSARLLASPFPVLRIWEVNQEGYAGEPAVDLAEGPSRLLAIRPALEVRLHALGAGEFRLLTALDRGQPLAAAARAALGEEPDADLGALLVRHARLGTLGGPNAAARAPAPPDAAIRLSGGNP